MEPVYLAPGNVDPLRVASGMEYVRAGCYLCPVFRRVQPVVISADRKIITFPMWGEFQPAVVDRIYGNPNMGIPDQYYAHSIEPLQSPWGHDRLEVNYHINKIMDVLNGDPLVNSISHSEARLDVVGIGWFNERPGIDNSLIPDGPLFNDSKGRWAGFKVPEDGESIKSEVLYNVMLEAWGKSQWRDLHRSLMVAKNFLTTRGRTTINNAPRMVMVGPRRSTYLSMRGYTD